ncbi:MAG TPA: 5-histidylcysteine sulfoxide synthase [Paludibacteraceae bacterium]|nr:5-histidylcysteine sulfoxide synthase [Paludibacteraceae bacterium]
MQEYITTTLNLQQGTATEKRNEIRNYFLKTWEVDEKLYTQLKSDDVFYHRGDPLRHVLLFYLGHTAVFYINKLMLAKIIDTRINPEFESIFAIGVDEMSWDDLNEKHYNWPSVDAVREYRDKAKEVVLKVIDEVPLSMPVTWRDPFWIILMGIEHERIHLETSSVLIRQLPLNEVVSGRFGKICDTTGEAPENDMIPVSGSVVVMGKPEDHRFYGWDNEYGKYEERVDDFRASKYLISNGEYLKFIQDGGYRTPEYWTEEGWQWRTFKEAEMPLFWRKYGENYKLRLVAEEIPMPWNWPVEVNYLEAKAYANWKSRITGKKFRLPTEAEWLRLHETTGLKDADEWQQAPGNINLEYYTSPCPVDMFKQGDFYDIVGNVWQWTETPITGYPGFKVHALYDDFSTPTFDGKHNLIKGGSWISTGNEATIHARYAFRRHFYQHAGIRLVESDTPLTIVSNEYETDAEVTLSCEANWGDQFTNAPVFSFVLAKLVKEVAGERADLRVLDLNADTGRLAFELAQSYNDVTALDFTARMIRMPIQLQEKSFMRYVMKDEGELLLYRDVVLSDFGLEKGRENILFMQADAMNLKPIYTGYDVIVVPNLLEELNNPLLFLSKIHERLNENGWLIITSTYEWDETRTRRENWPGGFKQDGEPVTSLDGIKKILNMEFELTGEPVELNLVQKLSGRMSVLKLSQLTVWKKR